VHQLANYDSRSSALNKLVYSTPKELWKAVNKSRNKNVDNRVHNILRDPDTANSFLAKVASKQYYDKHETDIYRTNNDGSEVCLLTNIEAEQW